MKRTIRTAAALGCRCYACSAPSVGVRDRRPEGGHVEPACARHAEPGLRVQRVCGLCDGIVRGGALDIDGELVHQKCHREACA